MALLILRILFKNFFFTFCVNGGILTTWVKGWTSSSIAHNIINEKMLGMNRSDQAMQIRS